jgi:hypothetical protein
MRSVVEERDEDRDDVRTDWPEPTSCCRRKSGSRRELSEAAVVLCNVQFSVKSFLSLCKEAVVSHCRT